jgi:deoxycytidylate deaminase
MSERSPSGLQKHDRAWMNVAYACSQLSKCRRAKYGSVLIGPNKRQLSMGYNGKPAESTCDGICFRENLPPNAPKDNCCLHSEDNCITDIGTRNIPPGSTLYVTGVPCNDCALKIMQARIARLVYFDGAGLTGHTGSSNNEYWERYGFDSRIERVPFTFEAWEELYGAK